MIGDIPSGSIHGPEAQFMAEPNQLALAISPAVGLVLDKSILNRSCCQSSLHPRPEGVYP